MKSRAPLYVLILLCIGATRQALAGPPLSIGDPGVLDPGRWEIITATTASSIDDDDFYQVPILDVSLGLIADTLQVSAAYPYVFAQPDDGDSDSDFGNLELGATWRLWQNERSQVALAPTYSFGITRSTAEQGIGDSGDVFALPVVVEHEFNPDWRLNTSIAYEFVEGAGDVWAYGAAIAYTRIDRWELLLELAGATNTDLEDNILDLRCGFDFAFTEDFHLLFSVATGLDEPGSEQELDYDVFLGLQFLL